MRFSRGGGLRSPAKIESAIVPLLDLTRDELQFLLSASQLANVPLGHARKGQWRLTVRLALSSLLRAEIVHRAGNGYGLVDGFYDYEPSEIENIVSLLPNDVGWELTIAELAGLILDRMRGDESFQPTENTAAIRAMIMKHATNTPDEQCDTPTPVHHAVLVDVRNQTHCEYLARACIANLWQLHLLHPNDEARSPFTQDSQRLYEQAVAEYAAAVTVSPRDAGTKDHSPSPLGVDSGPVLDYPRLRAHGRKSLANASPKLLLDLTNTTADAIAEVRQWIAGDDSLDVSFDAQLKTGILNTCFTVVQKAPGPLSVDAIRDNAKDFMLGTLGASAQPLLDQPLTRSQIASVPSWYRDDSSSWNKETYDALRALVAIGAVERLHTLEFVLTNSWQQGTLDDVTSELETLRRQRTVPMTVLEVQHVTLRVLQVWQSLRPRWRPAYMQLFAIIEDGFAATARPGDLDLPMTTEQLALLYLPLRVTAKQTQVGNLFHTALQDLYDCRTCMIAAFWTLARATDLSCTGNSRGLPNALTSLLSRALLLRCEMVVLLSSRRTARPQHKLLSECLVP